MSRGEGFRARLSRIPGQTPKGLLAQPLYLPALLNDIANVETAIFSEYTTISNGEFSQPAMGPATARSLRTPEDFETLTVDWDPPWLVQRGIDPNTVRDTLFEILRSRKPVHVLVTPKLGDGPVVVNMDITFRQVIERVKGGEPDAVYFSITPKEWRKDGVQRSGEGRSDSLPTTHDLTDTDSLYSLSQHYYHSALGADDIAKANGIKSFGKKTLLVKHPRFKVGSKLKIPLVAIASINAPKD